MLLIYGCSTGSNTTSSENKSGKAPVLLSQEFIFNPDSVKHVTEKASPAQKAESRKLFMNGLDLLVNKNNPEASIEYFKEAVSYYPDEKSYSFLFKAYLATNRLNMADSVNRVNFGFLEYCDALFNDALVYAAKKDTVECINALSESVRTGFSSGEKVTKEPLFDFVRENREFQGMVVANFGNDELMRKKLYAHYLKSFDDITLPFELKSDSVAAFNYDRYINYDFAAFVPGMEDQRFSRMVSQEYMAIGKFKLSKGYAIIYKAIEVMGDTLNPVTTSIITYDSLGTVVSNSVISCFCSPPERKSCVINPDMSIYITELKVSWQKDPLESGYSGNTITSMVETGKKKLFINPGNEVVEMPEGKESVASAEKAESLR